MVDNVATAAECQELGGLNSPRYLERRACDFSADQDGCSSRVSCLY